MYYTSQAFSLVSWTNIPPFFCAIFIFVAVVILVGIALIELIVAKFGLAIFLVLAPLAIPTFLFKATKEMIGDGWLKHLITFAFIPIFITSAMALGLMLMVHVDDQMKHSVQVGTLVFSDICPYLIYSIACIGLLFKAATMAANIAGGFASSAANVFGHVGSKMLDGLKKLLKGNPNKAKGGKSGKSGKDNGTSQGNKPSNDPAPNTNNS
jgi:type IV secretion system protein VirB6